MKELNCILIGFNEIDFADFARVQKVFADASGGYKELMTNSVLLGDRRITQNVLLSAIGADIYINDFRGESTLAAVLECLRGDGDMSAVPNLIDRTGTRICDMSRTLRKAGGDNLDEKRRQPRREQRRLGRTSTGVSRCLGAESASVTAAHFTRSSRGCIHAGLKRRRPATSRPAGHVGVKMGNHTQDCARAGRWVRSRRA